MKKIAQKFGVGGMVAAGLMAVAGVALATFLITQTISTTNIVTAESAVLQVTASAFNLNGLIIGGSSAGVPLTIKDSGNAGGDLQIAISNVSGANCQFMTLTISGTATGSAAIANGNIIDLGNLAGGATDTLTQVVSLSNSGQLGQTCHWDEVATLSGN